MAEKQAEEPQEAPPAPAPATLDQEQRAIDAMRETLDRMNASGRDMTWRLQNGLVLRCKPVPQSYLQAINERFAPPPPPKVTVNRSDGTTWEEENESDPEWLRQCAKLEDEREIAYTRLCLCLGTEIEQLAEGMDPPDGEEWIAHLRRAEKVAGVAMPVTDADLEDPDLRYFAWLRFYAIDNESDLTRVGYLPQLLGGLREGDIASMLAAFRSLQRRAAAGEGATPQPSANGHQPRAARRRAGR